MSFYRFIKKSSIKAIAGYDIESMEPVTVFDSEFILSNMDTISQNGRKYVYSLVDGLLYPTTTDGKENFDKQTAVDAVVHPQLKSGLAVMNNTRPERQEVFRLKKGDHIILHLDFITDKEYNIWAACTVLDQENKILVYKGYVSYKTSWNGYANLIIPDSKHDVLTTNGVLDPEKVNELKALKPTDAGIALMALSPSASALTTKNVNTGSILDPAFKKAMKEMRFPNYAIKLDPAYKSFATKSAKRTALCAQKDPSLYQNPYGFPKAKKNKQNGMYEYDFYMDYTKIPELASFKKIHARENIDKSTLLKVYNASIDEYNRYKLPMPDDVLSRGYMHIFFTRPDCNIVSNGKLTDEVKNDPFVKYMWQKRSKLVKELIIHNGSNHDFNLFLSNKAKGFNLDDDGLKDDVYGKSRNGYGIAFGRRRNGDLGGQFNIDYQDSRNLDVLQLHKLWVEYAENVYSGKWTPKMTHIANKELDYACSMYVIVLAENFEDVLYIAKYYGVFPINVPYSGLSWTWGSPITAPTFSVTYRYSWKREYDPLLITDFNTNCFRQRSATKIRYLKNYLSNFGTSAYTWTGPPFIERIRHKEGVKDLHTGSRYVDKLRFKPPENYTDMTFDGKKK